MKNIYILGAGDLGREFESWFDLFSSDKMHYQIKGFLDDDLNALDGFPSDYKILGKIKEFQFTESDYAVMAISNPKIKEGIFEFLKDKVKFYTFIPTNAIIGKFVTINEGCILAPNVIVTTNVVLGKCVTLNCGTQVGHDVIIEDFCSLMANVDLGGGVVLEKGVYIGTNATIIPRIKISKHVLIGAGSIVINKISLPQSVFGNPAKKI